MMARFDYRLESVLNIKEKLEDHAKNQLAVQIKKLDTEEKKLSSIHTQKNQCFSNVIQETAEGTYVCNLRQYNFYLSAVNSRINEQTEMVKNASQNVNNQRIKLINAAKERKILETLKDKHKEIFRKEQMKEEEKRTDELLSYKYTLK